MGSGTIRVTALVLVALAIVPLAAPQAANFTPTRLVQAEREQSLISRDRAAEIAREATGGRVLRVDRRGNGRSWYRVKVLVDGQRVRTLGVDAQSGRIRD